MSRLAFEKDTAFPVVCFQDKPFLFVEYRVDPDTIPEGMHMYEAADGDGDGCFARIQKYVLVNFWGTLIGPEPLDIPDNGVYYPTYGSYEYEGSYGYYKMSEEDDEEDALTADELREAWEYDPSQFASDAEPADDPTIALLPGKKYLCKGTLTPAMTAEVINGKAIYKRTEDINDASIEEYKTSLRENLEIEGLLVEKITVDACHIVSAVFTVGKNVVRNMTIRDAFMRAGDDCGIECSCGIDDIN